MQQYATVALRVSACGFSLRKALPFSLKEANCRKSLQINGLQTQSRKNFSLT